MTEINYITGDATNPQSDGMKIIVHVCNNIGAWGAGFVIAISKKWKAPETHYRNKTNYILGTYDLVKVEENIQVCNLIGQENIISRMSKNSEMPPVRYIAIETALKKLASTYNIINNPFTVHMPRIGSGLAGGNWNIIETVIKETLCKANIPVTVYDLPQ